MGFFGKNTEWVAMPTSRDLPNQGIKAMPLMSLALAGGFLSLKSHPEGQLCI